MNNGQTPKKCLKLLREFLKEVSKNPQLGVDLLIKAGIITKKGNLRKPYKGDGV